MGLAVVPEFSLRDRIVLVTGASRGIGREIALTVAEAGAHVALLARTEEEISLVAERIEEGGQRAIAIPTDVTDRTSVEQAVDSVLSELGRIDTVVNNAGTLVFKPFIPLPGYAPEGARDIQGFFDPTTDDEWNRVINTNLTSAMYLCRAIGPHMLARGSGRVVNIGSFSGIRGQRFHLSYDVSKGALAQFTRSLAVEWASRGVTVNCIAAGHIDTELIASAMAVESKRAQMLKTIPLRRVGSPREVALLVAYLASDAAGYLTGQVISLDGGASA